MVKYREERDSLGTIKVPEDELKNILTVFAPSP